MWALILTKSLIEDYLTPDMLASLGSIQYEMDAKYQEKSMLTNLFTEHKFWGWTGLLLIFVALAAIFYFQFQAWEHEDQERNN